MNISGFMNKSSSSSSSSEIALLFSSCMESGSVVLSAQPKRNFIDCFCASIFFWERAKKRWRHECCNSVASRECDSTCPQLTSSHSMDWKRNSSASRVPLSLCFPHNLSKRLLSQFCIQSEVHKESHAILLVGPHNTGKSLVRHTSPPFCVLFCSNTRSGKTGPENRPA